VLRLRLRRRRRLLVTASGPGQQEIQSANAFPSQCSLTCPAPMVFAVGGDRRMVLESPSTAEWGRTWRCAPVAVDPHPLHNSPSVAQSWTWRFNVLCPLVSRGSGLFSRGDFTTLAPSYSGHPRDRHPCCPHSPHQNI
jgi:hypothetical protein